MGAVELVGEPSWGFLIPRLHHALAGATMEFPVLEKASSTALHPGARHAFWETAWYAARCLLGWRDAGLGYRTWFQGELETKDEPLLTLLKEVWLPERRLDSVALWLWTRNPGKGVTENLEAVGARSEPPPGGRAPADFLGQAWWDAYRRLPVASVQPFGSNELHLGHSIAAVMGGRPGLLVSGDKATRRATLVLESARGWYLQLMKQGRQLPRLVDQSWRVDVVVKPIGWMGTFRLSRVTGLWFTGKHSTHLWGNRVSA
jgi:hypothetical protein